MKEFLAFLSGGIKKQLIWYYWPGIAGQDGLKII